MTALLWAAILVGAALLFGKVAWLYINERATERARVRNYGALRRPGEGWEWLETDGMDDASR